ncbi:MAG: OadG family protein [Clostridia bacterium]|nr:OadG family protein [Clostridia bacterium]
MLTNLLTETLPEGGRYVGIGEVSLYALIGFLVVFAGIAFLILVVWAVGKFMTKFNGVKKTAKEKKKPTETVSESLAVTDAQTDEISEETVAVITAAIMAYYQKTNPKCEFTVKRIKRI